MPVGSSAGWRRSWCARKIKGRLKQINFYAFDTVYAPRHRLNRGSNRDGRCGASDGWACVYVCLFAKRQLRLGRLVTETSLPLAVLLQAKTYFAAPVRRHRRGVHRAVDSATADTLPLPFRRKERATDATLCCFGAIDRATLLADLDHRAVLRCGRFLRTRSEGREDSILVWAEWARRAGGMFPIVHPRARRWVQRPRRRRIMTSCEERP